MKSHIRNDIGFTKAIATKDAGQIANYAGTHRDKIIDGLDIVHVISHLPEDKIITFLETTDSVKKLSAPIEARKPAQQSNIPYSIEPSEVITLLPKAGRIAFISRHHLTDGQTYSRLANILKKIKDTSEVDRMNFLINDVISVKIITPDLDPDAELHLLLEGFSEDSCKKIFLNPKFQAQIKTAAGLANVLRSLPEEARNGLIFTYKLSDRIHTDVPADVAAINGVIPLSAQAGFWRQYHSEQFNSTFDKAIALINVPVSADPSDPSRKFKTALEDLKKKTVDDFTAGKLTEAGALIIAKQTLTLATCITDKNQNRDAKIDAAKTFHLETAMYKSTLSWRVILGAVIGAAIGIAIGIACPAALICATVLGLTLASGGAIFGMWHTRKADPINLAIDAARNTLPPPTVK